MCIYKILWVDQDPEVNFNKKEKEKKDKKKDKKEKEKKKDKKEKDKKNESNISKEKSIVHESAIAEKNFNKNEQ